MPFALVTVGLVLVLSAYNGTYADLGNQLKKDLFTTSSGHPSFIYWILALVIVGMIGYIPQLKKPSTAFIVLIICGMVLANGTGLFSKFTAAIQSGPTADSGASPLNAIPLTGSSGSIPAASLLSAAPGVASSVLTSYSGAASLLNGASPVTGAVASSVAAGAAATIAGF